MKLRILSTLILFGFALLGISQTGEADLEALRASAQAAYERGAEAFSRNDLEAAIAAFQEAARGLAITDPGSMSLAKVYNNLGSSLNTVDRAEEAEQWLKKALAIKEKLAPGSIDLANTLNNLGLSSERRGRLDDAVVWFMRSAAIKEEKAPGQMVNVSTYNNLCNVWRAKGDLRQSKSWGMKALLIVERNDPQSSAAAGTFNNLGSTARQLGNYREADGWYRRALKIKEQRTPGSIDVATTCHNLGNLAVERGDPEAAQSWYQRALAIKEAKAQGTTTLAGTLMTLGAQLALRGAADDALALLHRALEIFRSKAPGSIDEALVHEQLGLVANSPSSAEACYLKSYVILKAKAPQSLAMGRVNGMLGLIRRAQGRFAEAESFFTKAVSLMSRRSPMSVDMARALGSLGILYDLQGRYAEAERAFARSNMIIDAQHSALRSPNSRSLFLDLFEKSTAPHVDALVHLGRERDVVRLLEFSKAKRFAEDLSQRGVVLSTPEIEALSAQLNAAFANLASTEDVEQARRLRGRIAQLSASRREAENSYATNNPKSAALAFPRTLDLAGIQKLLDADTLVLHYTLGREFGYVVAIANPTSLGKSSAGHAGLRIQKIHTSLDAVNSMALDFRTIGAAGAIRSGATQPPPRSGAARAAGAKLYACLIKPVRSLITGGRWRRLVICPTGPLNTLPFAALPIGKGGYLGDLLPIAVVPSLTALAEVRRSEFGDRSTPAFVMGDPAYGPQLQRLPNTRDEANTIARLYGVKPVLGNDATISNLKRGAASARVVHIACHGKLDPVEPMASSLTLAPDASDNGVLQAWRVFGELHLRADLVVLSACQTGLGTGVGNEGISGLTRAFQFAGARSVVVSLWSVDDKSTAEFMKRFYIALRAGRKPDQSLQVAQKALRKRYPNPYYWAPFVLWGDWR